MKNKNTLIENVKPVEYPDSDPLDGNKAVGCLFVGILILLIAGYSFWRLIEYLRPPQL